MTPIAATSTSPDDRTLAQFEKLIPNQARTMDRLVELAEDGNAIAIRLCLFRDAAGPSLRRYDWVALEGAITGGHCELIAQAVQRAVETHREPSLGGVNAAIDRCIQRKHYKALEQLNQPGAFPHWRLYYYREAVQSALRCDNSRAYHLLVGRGERPPQNEALQVAAGGTGMGFVRFLIKQGADVNYYPALSPGNFQYSWFLERFPPLFAAAESKNLQAAGALLEAGARMGSGPFGYNLLWLTCFPSQRQGDPETLTARRHELIQTFLKGGVDADASQQPRLAVTPLMALCKLEEKGIVPSMKLLVDAGAKLDAAPAGYTALHHLAGMKHPEAAARAELLLEVGATVDVESCLGRTAYHMAIASSNTVMAELLVKYGADTKKPMPSLPATAAEYRLRMSDYWARRRRQQAAASSSTKRARLS